MTKSNGRAPRARNGSSREALRREVRAALTTAYELMRSSLRLDALSVAQPLSDLENDLRVLDERLGADHLRPRDICPIARLESDLVRLEHSLRSGRPAAAVIAAGAPRIAALEHTVRRLARSLREVATLEITPERVDFPSRAALFAARARVALKRALVHLATLGRAAGHALAAFVSTAAGATNAGASQLKRLAEADPRRARVVGASVSGAGIAGALIAALVHRRRAARSTDVLGLLISAIGRPRRASSSALLASGVALAVGSAAVAFGVARASRTPRPTSLITLVDAQGRPVHAHDDLEDDPADRPPISTPWLLRPRPTSAS